MKLGFEWFWHVTFRKAISLATKWFSILQGVCFSHANTKILQDETLNPFPENAMPNPILFFSLRKRLLYSTGRRASHCVLEIGTKAVELLFCSRIKQHDSGTQTFFV